MDRLKESAGKWDAVMEVSFPGEQEGLLEVKKFLSYSTLKMPHAAPVEGYKPTWRYESKNYDGFYGRADFGFFLRTRVKLDDKGNIISANYAKIMGDLYPDAGKGFVGFIYYFNPVPNDRNLEFDLKRNLFPKGKSGAEILDP